MAWLEGHLLSVTIFLPLAGALAVACLPARWKWEIRSASLLGSSATLLLAAAIFSRMRGTGDFEMAEVAAWIPSLGVRYHLGVDGVSAALMLLVALLVPPSLLISWREIDHRVKAFHLLLLLLETGMLGALAALDAVLFFIFWEAALIPMAFLIGVWGGTGRARASLAFLLFGLVGSALLLAAILGAGGQAGSFDVLAWYAHRFHPVQQLWLFAGFAAAFGIATPFLGLHSWLPDAVAEAPAAVGLLLVGAFLKMGTYGLWRFAMPAFPLAVAGFLQALLVLAVLGIVVGALLAMVQPDLKRLVAYASVSHLGFVLLGLAALEPQAAAGAVVQMVAHGLTAGMLVLVIGMLSARRGAGRIEAYGGTAREAPLLSLALIFAALAAAGLPGLANFSGEFLVLLGAFQTRTAFGAAAIAGAALGAAALLWAVVRVVSGPSIAGGERRLPDLTFREGLSIVPLIALAVLIGVWPQGMLAKLWRPAESLVKLSTRVEMFTPVSPPSLDVSFRGAGDGE